MKGYIGPTGPAFSQTFMGIRLDGTVNQSIPTNSTTTVITFPDINYSVGNISTLTNSSIKFNVSGYYLINGCVLFTPGTSKSSSYTLYIHLNYTTILCRN